MCVLFAIYYSYSSSIDSIGSRPLFPSSPSSCDFPLYVCSFVFFLNAILISLHCSLFVLFRYSIVRTYIHSNIRFLLSVSFLFILQVFLVFFSLSLRRQSVSYWIPFVFQIGKKNHWSNSRSLSCWSDLPQSPNGFPEEMDVLLSRNNDESLAMNQFLSITRWQTKGYFPLPKSQMSKLFQSRSIALYNLKCLPVRNAALKTIHVDSPTLIRVIWIWSKIKSLAICRLISNICVARDKKGEWLCRLIAVLEWRQRELHDIYCHAKWHFFLFLFDDQDRGVSICTNSNMSLLINYSLRLVSNCFHLNSLEYSYSYGHVSCARARARAWTQILDSSHSLVEGSGECLSLSTRGISGWARVQTTSAGCSGWCPSMKLRVLDTLSCVGRRLAWQWLREEIAASKGWILLLLR